MSSVSGTDGIYKEYQRSINDLKEQYDRETKRNENKNEKRIQDLEEKQRAALARKDSEIEKTANSLRKQSQEQIAHERDVAKSDVERIKGQTYDRYGRYNGLDADTIKRQFERAKGSWEMQSADYKKKLDDSERDYQHKLKDLRDESEEKIARQHRQTRESLVNEGERISRANNLTRDEARKEVEAQFAEVARTNADENKLQKQLAERAVNDAKLDFEHRVDKLKDNKESKFQDMQKSFALSKEQDARTLRNAHIAETRELRDTMKDLIEAEGTYMKEVGQGTLEATKKYEEEWSARLRDMATAHEGEVDQLRAQIKDNETYMSNLSERNLHDREMKFAKMIGSMNQEAHGREKALAQTFDENQRQFDTQIKREREIASKSTENLLSKANEGKSEALLSQAEDFQESSRHSAAISQDTINVLQKELNKARRKESNPTELSPAVEDAARKVYGAQYHELLEAEQERNRRGLDSAQKNFSERLQETYTTVAEKSTREIQQHTAERLRDRNDLINFIEEVQADKEIALRNKDMEYGRIIDNLQRSFNNNMEKQRRQFEDSMQTQSNDAQAKFQSLKQQKDFESKVAMRTFSQKQNELIREYEKKLADQKADYDALLADTKAQADQQVRDAEKRNKQMVEDQAKMHEQRLAQLEAQQEARVKTVTQNFQEDLEKVKRSNAELIKKKS